MFAFLPITLWFFQNFWGSEHNKSILFQLKKIPDCIGMRGVFSCLRQFRLEARNHDDDDRDEVYLAGLLNCLRQLSFEQSVECKASNSDTAWVNWILSNFHFLSLFRITYKYGRAGRIFSCLMGILNNWLTRRNCSNNNGNSSSIWMVLSESDKGTFEQSCNKTWGN